MIPITRINHVGIRVVDLERTRAFYEQLGFVFLAGPVGPEPVAIMEHPSGVNLNFILNASAGKAENILMDIPDKLTGYTHVALQVSNLDLVQQQLEQLGLTITEGPIETPEGARFLFIRDPDRNVLEFHQPAPRPDFNL